MKALIQRVKNAQVEVHGKTVGKINRGILALIGVEKLDSQEKAEKLIKKIICYRIFVDDNDKMNLSLQEISGELFTAKDFRTWSGTLIFFESLIENEPSDAESEIKKNVIKAFDDTAKALGNTRNVCKKYYVHPFVVNKYEKRELNDIFESVEIASSSEYQTAAEKVLIKVIADFNPLLNLDIKK
jgi:D-Tyr-tRNAtyr deacylase